MHERIMYVSDYDSNIFDTEDDLKNYLDDFYEYKLAAIARALEEADYTAITDFINQNLSRFSDLIKIKADLEKLTRTNETVGFYHDH